MKNARKNSLDEITHKNKDEILYYVPEAKVEIYPQYIICYDPIFYTGLPSCDCESYVNQFMGRESEVNQNQGSTEAEKVDNKNDKSTLQQESNQKTENHGKCNQQQHKKAPTPMAAKDQKNLHLNPCKQELESPDQICQKIIYFNNSDIAFYVNESEKAIQIHDMVAQRILLRFIVQNNEVMFIVQSLLRKKLCELGFFNKYKMIKLLGKGGTAMVHLVQRISDKKSFAAKIISTLNSNQKQFELFTNEAKLLRILKHQNIINLESVYIHKTELIQVLEYLPGGTLLDFLKKNQIRTNEKWVFLQQLTSALEYLRQRRIVHRDLKLENIMIRSSTNSKEVVLSDFGLACWAGQKNPIYEKCGTPGYIAPQILNSPPKSILIDHRSDIFSLGVIAHLLFLHEPLFHFKGSLKDLIEQNKKASFNLNSSKYQKLAGQQLNFLMLTLSKDINNRVTADQLSSIVNVMACKTERKSLQKVKRKLSFDVQNPIMDVQIKKEGSLRKKAIKIDLECIKAKKDETKESESKSPTRRSLAQNARKMVSNFWETISPTSKKSERLKLKQNSLQKQRKYSDFLNQ